MAKLFNLKSQELKLLATAVGSTPGYMQQVMYGHRRPSSQLAKKISEALRDLFGFSFHVLYLLYPEDYSESGQARNRVA